MQIDSEKLNHAAQEIQKGNLVIFPTETVYGLGADATNDEAVKSIYVAKERPFYDPLIVHVTGIGMLKGSVQMIRTAEKLINTFWPGPLTLVLKRKKSGPISPFVCNNGPTVAVRCPAHKMALELIARAGRPIAAPSANLFGQLSPTCIQDLNPQLIGRVADVLDGGPCSIGVESTVVLLTEAEPVILRPGFITKEALERSCDLTVHLSQGDGKLPQSPGQLKSHYAPQKHLRINVQKPQDDEAFIGFGALDGVLNLSPTGDVNEAARHLYAYLKQLDRDPHVQKIAVAPVPDKGIGLAVNDRLRRASSKD